MTVKPQIEKNEIFIFSNWIPLTLTCSASSSTLCLLRYLDCGFGRWRETGEAACDPYKPWQTVYTHRPWQQNRLNKNLIVGGEVCLWSEQLDQTSLDARLWPRAAAFAERMWSDPQVDLNSLAVSEDVYTRLTTQRERLITRDLKPEAMWPQWCTQNPGMCL